MLKKLLSFFKKTPVQGVAEEKEVPTMKIWGITEGPFHASELDDPNIPDDLEYMMVCKVEVDGSIIQKEFYFNTHEEAYHLVKYFSSNIKPIEVSYG